MRIPVLCALVLAAACGQTEEEIQQARCAGERPYRDMTKDELDEERTRIMKLEMGAIMGTRAIRQAVPTTLLPPEVEAALEEFARDRKEAESAARAFRIEEECRRAAEEEAGLRACMPLMYVDGRGVPKDDHEAVRWCRLAARSG